MDILKVVFKFMLLPNRSDKCGVHYVMKTQVDLQVWLAVMHVIIVSMPDTDERLYASC